MTIEVFIPIWPGAEGSQAVAGYSDICTVTLLNNPNHYFTEQWNEMLKRMTADIVIWHMADVSADSSDLRKFVDRAMHSIANQSVGVYAPNVDHTDLVYDTRVLPLLWLNVFEVKNPEALVLAASRVVLKDMQAYNRWLFNPTMNKYGWGIDDLLCNTSRRMGLKVVRDYGLTFQHPKGKGYDEAVAQYQMEQCSKEKW